MLTIEKIADNVQKIAPNYPINRVELFGSYAQGSQTDKSDVDLLVEVKSPGISLLTLSALRLSLEDELGVEVDLVRGPIPENSLLSINKSVMLYER